MRIFMHIAWWGPFAVFAGIFKFVYFGRENRGYEPDRLTYLSRRIGGRIGVPTGALNQRTSAHYIEINHLYGAQMIKKYHATHGKVIEERSL
jgi:hypothetical protein